MKWMIERTALSDSVCHTELDTLHQRISGVPGVGSQSRCGTSPHRHVMTERRTCGGMVHGKRQSIRNVSTLGGAAAPVLKERGDRHDQGKKQQQRVPSVFTE